MNPINNILKVPFFIHTPIRYFVMTVIFVSVVLGGYAQEYESEDILLEQLEDDISVIEEINSEHDGALNDAHLLQLGTYNQSDIEQNNNGSFSRPNVGLVFQQGAHNEVFILQAGSGNKSTSVQQGFSNDYELYLLGDDNTTNVYQRGEGNNVEQYISADGVDYTVVQQGVNNELIQIENNPEMPAYKVFQRGVGISIVIENYSVY